MSQFYTKLAATASSLLTKYGQTVTFSRAVGATFNPATGTDTGGSTSTWTGKGASFNYNSSEIDGAMIQESDIRLLAEAVATQPVIGDQVTVNSIAYHVVSVNETSPGGTVVKYDIQLRK
jgi:hypothetical protein